MTDAEQWPGCHGVRLSGEAAGLGTASGNPLAQATVRFGPVAEPEDGTELWTQHGEAVVEGERFEVDRVLHLSRSGSFVVTGAMGPPLEVDQRSGTITIEAGDKALQLQLLATFGVPLILHTTGALLLHGSACTLGDETILVCGDSGSGKSTLLVGLVDAGWTPVTEDLSAIDLRGAMPMVWPGPPWVRITHGKVGPHGSRQLFDSKFKTGWDISASQATGPTAVTRVVLLEAPGGDDALFEPIPPPAAIRALARHGVWLGDQDERARRLFGPTAGLVAKVPTMRLRLPRSDSWLDKVPSLLASAV